MAFKDFRKTVQSGNRDLCVYISQCGQSGNFELPIFYRQCKKIICRDKLQRFRFLVFTRYDSTLPPVDVMVAVVEDLIRSASCLVCTLSGRDPKPASGTSNSCEIKPSSIKGLCGWLYKKGVWLGKYKRAIQCEAITQPYHLQLMVSHIHIPSLFS